MIQYAATLQIGRRATSKTRRLLMPAFAGMTIGATIPALHRLGYCCRVFDSDQFFNVSQA
jgi:hypothetical protein